MHQFECVSGADGDLGIALPPEDVAIVFDDDHAGLEIQLTKELLDAQTLGHSTLLAVHPDLDLIHSVSSIASR